ncbi:unnamed protein product [Didymodactylos carnosus]|uniref:Ephrin RBD domain-containing protein n=1 Tax=Didymodactylos carnosus TaxID=1234261 RepID=A0A813TPD4_9BILA|nr:unnamed protein product [Didymodactylos carnosus]CAF0815462.1 unnamed protein product [Didymodactylos carnosus]CAF3501293.1 unnamed protein product [Didymodactylos carnosus]CAF3601516.1 unnamed protein product [Didymodactylos carnosus]
MRNKIAQEHLSPPEYLRHFVPPRSIHRRHHHHHPNTIQIYWNSTNELFSLSSSQSTAILYVHLGDKVDFICPKSMNPLYDPVEYNSLYIVSKDAYRQCYSSNYKPLIRCNRPFETQIYTMTISNFLPYPDAIEFHEQQEYYFISTSNGDIEGIDQKYDGLCRTKNMKLIMDVQKYYNHYSSIPNLTSNLLSILSTKMKSA